MKLDIQELNRQRRGHPFYWFPDETPGLYETEDIDVEDKIVHAHFFGPSQDWYITELDPMADPMRVTIETQRDGGQERDYGPTVYTGSILVEFEPRVGEGYVPWDNCSEEQILRYLKGFRSFDPPDEGDWFSNLLKHIEQVEPGLWFYRIERAWDD